ncbi:hypothetical protein Cgig2_012609 [Carnegiea gigantea]|uniref:chloroplast protein-transporting ATPase n=1 Tax=Carnegiea gigantea TaxID=171969 RepID=A0A9Q1JI38_9CARY|nr:hypothetical protein Cgig2_012609 [Carnegiea gigantea]
MAANLTSASFAIAFAVAAKYSPSFSPVCLSSSLWSSSSSSSCVKQRPCLSCTRTSSSFLGRSCPCNHNCQGKGRGRGRLRLQVVALSMGLGGLLGSIFKGGDPAESTRQQYASKISLINQLEPQISSLSDSQLTERTSLLRQRALSGETLDSLLPEAFAVVREASKRVLGLRPFDVQLIGGMVLHKGEIAEMRTGEGKTLVAVLPAYLNALTGKGVHVVTVNDYLARRDCEWVGQVPRFLGLKVGLIQRTPFPFYLNLSSLFCLSFICGASFVSPETLSTKFLRLIWGTNL